MTSILFKNLSKSFTYGFLRRQKVLQSISLEIRKGEVFGFLGPNGAGKSTAINIALGFIKPDEGVVFLNGISSENPLARKYLGYLPENPHFSDYLTAYELLKFSGLASGTDKKIFKKRIDPILSKMELLPFKHRTVRTFSKGMKQRIGLAMALISDPPILILDEPMSGLDPMGRRLVTDLILELKAEGKTIFFSTHILNDVEILCDKIAVLDKGTILYRGATHDFISGTGNLEDAFLELIKKNQEISSP
jgi:ABC-2 type transport system ATP-binding protein